MAILALIVMPLVLNIIRKARVSADKRSIDAYGRSIELAIAGYLMDTGKFPTQISQLTIEYSGSEVVCETTQLNSDSSVYLTGCRVGGRIVDYAYGENKTPPAPTYQAYTISATAEDTPTWLYNSNYYYWTMSPWYNSYQFVWCVQSNGALNAGYGVNDTNGVVRPVIVLPKSAISS